MVQAVRRDPFDRAALQIDAAEPAQEILDRLERLEAAVGQQAVIADRDAKPADQVQHKKSSQAFPGEKDGQAGEQRAEMNESHRNQEVPADSAAFLPSADGSDAAGLRAFVGCRRDGGVDHGHSEYLYHRTAPHCDRMPDRLNTAALPVPGGYPLA